MAILKVWADTKGQKPCGSCGAAMTFYEMVKSGKRNPFDGDPVFVKTETDPATNRVIGFIDGTITPSHFATCPQRQQWRRP